MKALVDSAGRVLIPKALRTAAAMHPGDEVDISVYGDGVQIIPRGRAAKLVPEAGRLVVAGTTPVTDEMIYSLIDTIRK
ncbi:MAG: AbrB/MazE/SpoVT family DNA-binding domain-containing protein [Bifidobacteriaceae bacterium]|jgi:AbrB family looped-hinge helix DNA binding protein|nr:AbrB/MazE/SpoVT family DNA-binding domain-containing protein [Bifidobacteriaceae bacterium]